MTYPQPGTKEWLAAKSTSPLWRYNDARGVPHFGYMEKTIDRGGTDVSYFMRDRDTGELSICNGSAAKAMERIWGNKP